ARRPAGAGRRARSGPRGRPDRRRRQDRGRAGADPVAGRARARPAPGRAGPVPAVTTARPRRAPNDDLDLDPFLRLLEERFALKIAPHQLDRMAASLRDLLGRTGYPAPAALLEALAGPRPARLTELATSLTIHET